MGSSSSSTISNPAIKTFIEKEVQKNPIVIFSKSYCPYCTATKQLFQSQSGLSSVQPPQVYELDRDTPNITFTGAQIQQTLAEMTGQRTVPSVWIKGAFVGGNSETQAAYKNGTLQTMLGL